MLNRILVAGAFIVGTTIAATAADLPSPPMAPAPPPPPPMASPAFDWSGPYIGAYGGVITDFSTYAPRAGVQAGFNVQRGSMVAGLEVQAGAYYAMGLLALEANINAILGFALGDRVLLYGEGGVGVAYAPSIPATAFLWSAGGGLAFAIRDPMSMFVEAKVAAPFGGGTLLYIFQAGLNWHR